mmetsp:Transcript_21665/g.43464  ORF Transcript_21665/g.43464 Transcript_21665/m.43464 type:complete len:285 (+) Transcript_21665:3341-4195(+)
MALLCLDLSSDDNKVTCVLESDILESVEGTTQSNMTEFAAAFRNTIGSRHMRGVMTWTNNLALIFGLEPKLESLFSLLLKSLATVPRISTSIAVCKVESSSRICRNITVTNPELPTKEQLGGSNRISSNPPNLRNFMAILLERVTRASKRRAEWTNPGAGGEVLEGRQRSNLKHSNIHNSISSEVIRGVKVKKDGGKTAEVAFLALSVDAAGFSTLDEKEGLRGGSFFSFSTLFTASNISAVVFEKRAAWACLWLCTLPYSSLPTWASLVGEDCSVSALSAPSK